MHAASCQPAQQYCADGTSVLWSFGIAVSVTAATLTATLLWTHPGQAWGCLTAPCEDLKSHLGSPWSMAQVSPGSPDLKLEKLSDKEELSAQVPWRHLYSGVPSPRWLLQPGGHHSAVCHPCHCALQQGQGMAPPCSAPLPSAWHEPPESPVLVTSSCRVPRGAKQADDGMHSAWGGIRRDGGDAWQL